MLACGTSTCFEIRQRPAFVRRTGLRLRGNNEGATLKRERRERSSKKVFEFDPQLGSTAYDVGDVPIDAASICD